jgi:aminoglycoside phosphotransferase (APT) family kinase protein
MSILEQFSASGQLEGASSTALRSTVADALELVRAGESIPGDWIYTHCDHKPENCLSQDGVLAVLDWDECNSCHPRLEAVESALRWAGIDDPNPEHFIAFMSGYNESGASLDTLRDQDFAKWIAALIGWFCFQARRTVGEWPEVTEAERTAAAVLARDALATLQSSLRSLSRWTRFL